MLEEILELIGKNHLEKALNLLNTSDKASIRSHVAQLRRQFIELNEDVLDGVISNEEKSRRYSQLTKSLIKLARASFDETSNIVPPTEKPFQKLKLFATIGIVFSILTVLVVLILNGQVLDLGAGESIEEGSTLIKKVELRGQVKCLNHKNPGILEIQIDTFSTFKTNDIGDFALSLPINRKNSYLVKIKKGNQIIFENYLLFSPSNPLVIPIKSRFCD